MRGMVVGEGGRSTGVLLYSITMHTPMCQNQQIVDVEQYRLIEREENVENQSKRMLICEKTRVGDTTKTAFSITRTDVEQTKI